VTSRYRPSLSYGGPKWLDMVEFACEACGRQTREKAGGNGTRRRCGVCCLAGRRSRASIEATKRWQREKRRGVNIPVDDHEQLKLAADAVGLSISIAAGVAIRAWSTSVLQRAAREKGGAG
jgi:hypothetical protein